MSPIPGLRVDSGHPRFGVVPLENQQPLPNDVVIQEKIARAMKQAASKPLDQPEKAKHELQY
jgi:hypothetical protein